jgi:hypothetical protein
LTSHLNWSMMIENLNYILWVMIVRLASNYSVRRIFFSI